MPKLPQLSLGNKIIANFILANIGSVLVALSLIGYFDYQQVKNDLIDEAQTTAKMLAQNTAPALLFQDREAADSSLNLLTQNPKFSAAIIHTLDQVKFTSFPKNAFPPELEPLQEQGVYFQEQFLSAVEKISIDGEFLGHITLYLSLDILTQRLKKYMVLLVSILLVSFLFVSPIILLIKRNLASPLEKLVDFAQDVTQSQNYQSRLQHHKADEIGSLVVAFNNMMETLESREKQLQEHTEGLEKLVALRSEQLHQRANFDSLTLLPNRHLLLDRLEQSIHKAERYQQQFALLFLDLDRFKLVNDNFGHATGDKLLIAVSKRLQSILRVEDTISRLGGDEFVILIHNVKEKSDIEKVANNIIKSLTTLFKIDYLKLYTSTSIGIAVYPGDGKTAELLIKRSDISMYRSKQRGVGFYTFYSPQFESDSQARLFIENEIRHAFSDDRYEVYYQPQHLCSNHELIGFECLVRLRDHENNIISPKEFIPVAEEIGVINKLGLWVTAQACKKLEEFRQQGKPDIKLSVNISAFHLMEPDFTEQITNISRNFHFDIKNLELEITEASVLTMNETTFNNIHQLREVGIGIAIDDFGTGYSSLHYLRDLSASTLKIDGSFIRGLEFDHSCRGIVSSTIVLGQSLGLKTVAEHVETESQLQFLKLHHCDIIQGYYFSQPLPVTELDAYLNQSKKIESIGQNSLA